MKKIYSFMVVASLFVMQTLFVSSCSSGNDAIVEQKEIPSTPESDPTPEPTVTTCQGWPENYGGVMLQGFYWDSYTDTQWKKLESQVDEFAQYFTLVWTPPSGWCQTTTNNMGYYPNYWLDQRSAFGTEDELRSMISTFKNKGIGTIADVVLNHHAGISSWTDFANETKDSYTIDWGTPTADICRGDECVAAGYPVTGAVDTGDNDGGCRDLDHTNATVQNNCKVYEQFLLKDMGFTGFRYDMVKGYGAQYVGMYNAATTPEFSVGEYWDGDFSKVKTWIDGTQQDGKIQSAAFDFPMRYNIKDAFGSEIWSALDKTALGKDDTYKRYAVTFVDNHDTGSSGKDGADPLYKNVEAANAYVLAMPGTPCVFLSHWKSFKVAIKKLIKLRQLIGIQNTSSIISQGTNGTGYYINVQGTKSMALVCFGGATPNTVGYKLAVEGTAYKYYVPTDLDITALDNIKEEAWTAPSCCKVNAGETCAFFEAPSTWSSVYAWVWDGSNNYTGGTWPGVTATQVGTTTAGAKVYKWTYDGDLKTLPTQIIFNNNGSQQTADLDFKNGGYYTNDGFKGIIK